MKATPVLRGLVVVVAVLYPVGVYFGLKVLPPSFFGLVLAVLLALRFGFIGPGERRVLMPLLFGFLAYALLAAYLNSERFLLYYPVLVNASLCVLFLASLRGGESILLRLVRSRNMKMSRYAPAYLRWLTLIWAGFFLANGLIAIWTTTRTLETWAVYNGFIAYLLIGVLIGAELLFRIYYKKRKGVHRI